MDFKSQTTRAPQTQTVAAPQATVSKVATEGKKSPVKTIIAVVASLIVVALAVLGFLLLQSKTSSVTAVDSNKFQAVFLTNGQVYFGKLSGLGSDYVDLENIYYLQVQQSVQPSTDQPQDTASTDNSQVSLTKLGNELHGPTDEMHISKDQVLFWENLKDDSTVVKAIKGYEDKK